MAAKFNEHLDLSEATNEEIELAMSAIGDYEKRTEPRWYLDVVRRAWVRYYNHTENKSRYTDRAARSLVRLFNVEDNCFVGDMSAVEAMISSKKMREKFLPMLWL